ncbi:lysine--tRNA ligase [Patescibacteria group bacterium]
MPKPKSRLEEIRNIRLGKVDKLRKLGIEPYPARSKKDHSNAYVLDNFKKFEGKTITLTGRLMSWREHGNIAFGHIQDESGQIQLFIQKKLLGKTSKKDQILGFKDAMKLLDIGDFVQATGKVGKTVRGEISLLPNELKILTKTIRPLPEKRKGLKDIEQKYRKRYLDILMNSDTKILLDARWLIEKETRDFLWGEGYTEVETPVLQEIYGGTNAKPFKTHMNALSSDFYLRVAPELYLKRLTVGGYEKIFEIARNFRNEGIDATHQPEFTMIEWYEAYGDYNSIMDTTEALTRRLVKKIYGDTKLKVNGKTIDVGSKWPREPMTQLIKKHLDLDVEKMSEADLKKTMKENKLELIGTFSGGKAIFTIFDHLVTKKLIDPIWVIDYPIEVCPLQKEHPDKKGYAERFEGYIGGIEYCDGWTEINDPIDQRGRFVNEQKNMRAGDDEAHPLDENFVESLEYGMPPMGGIGIGIDRLVMFLTDTWFIRKVIPFPTLRPSAKKSAESKKKNDKKKST